MSGRIKKVFVLFVVAAALICLGAASVFAGNANDACTPEAVSEEDTDESGIQVADNDPDIQVVDDGPDESDPESLAAPTLSSAGVVNGGIEVKWKSVSGAVNYYVYRKTSSSGSWSKVGETTSTSYTDKTAKTGKTYYYTVRAINSGGVLASYYDTSGVKLKYLSTPSLSSAKPAKSGVKVSWSEVSGAKKYRVYRKTSGGSWSVIGETTSTSYTDKTAKSGKTYIYTVRTLNSSGWLSSYYDTSGISIKYLATPTLSKAVPAKSGIKITWSNVSGTSKYRVYRKTSSSGSWEKIGETTSTSYTDKTAKTNKTYYYTVRAISGSYKSSYDSDGVKLKYLKTPTLSSAKPAKSGVKVSWSSVSGASKYRVYRKTSSGSWSKVGETTSTSYTDKTAKTGKTYYYTVRAINSGGVLASYYDTSGVKLKYLSTPSLSSAKPAKSGVKVSWSEVSGAKKYRVYRKTSSGSWSKVGETTSTSYTDKTAKTGKTYYYTVRAINSGGVLASYYDTSGVKLKYLKTPSLKSISITSSGIKIKWGSVSGAASYRIYRKTGGGSWKKIADKVSGTSYTDTTATSSVYSYSYTVRAINSDGVCGSYYKTSGLSLMSNLLSQIDSASTASSVKTFNSSYSLSSSAGKKLKNAVSSLKNAGYSVSFLMIDINTGQGVVYSAGTTRFGASTIKGPYVAAINKYYPSSVTSSVKSLMKTTISISSNENYNSLRSRFGSSPMSKLLSYTNVSSFSSSTTWPSYSPKTLAKLWVGMYWYFFVDTNSNSSYCRNLYTNSDHSFIHAALSSKYTVYTKPGWMYPGTWSGNIHNDAGIVSAGDSPYILAVMSNCYPDSQTYLKNIVKALDTVHSEMVG